MNVVAQIAALADLACVPPSVALVALAVAG